MKEEPEEIEKDVDEKVDAGPSEELLQALNIVAQACNAFVGNGDQHRTISEAFQKVATAVTRN